MWKNNLILILILAAIVWVGFINFPFNTTFKHYDTFALFPDGDSISHYIVTDSMSANSEWPYKKVRFEKVGPDTFLSQVIQNKSATTILSIKCDSLAAGDTASVYLGMFRGMAYGDTLGMEWYFLHRFVAEGKYKVVLYDSSWFTNQGAPYNIIKIVEEDSAVTEWVFDYINFVGGL